MVTEFLLFEPQSNAIRTSYDKTLTWRPMPAAARSILYSRDSARAAEFVRIAMLSA